MRTPQKIKKNNIVKTGIHNLDQEVFDDFIWKEHPEWFKEMEVMVYPHRYCQKQFLAGYEEWKGLRLAGGFHAYGRGVVWMYIVREIVCPENTLPKHEFSTTGTLLQMTDVDDGDFVVSWDRILTDEEMKILFDYLDPRLPMEAPDDIVKSLETLGLKIDHSY